MPRARRNRRAAPPSTAASESGEAEEQGPTIEVVEFEQPFGHAHRFQALKEAYEPGKRRATNAYDDIVCKRQKIDPQLGVQPPQLQSTGRARKPPSTATTPSQVDKTAHVRAYVADMRARYENEHERVPTRSPRGFSKLPAEICAIIFRYLLVHSKPILVLGGWGYVYPRGRPNLHTGLLGVCRDFYDLGLRTLYGENTFRYRTRDPSSAQAETYAVLKKVYEEDGCSIPVQKHGYRIRHVEIDIEANRMRDAKNRVSVVEALAAFLTPPLRAQLHTVTLEIYLETRKALRMEVSPTQPGNSYPALDLFGVHSDVLDCLHKINCQFVRIVAHRPQDEDYLYESVVDRHPYFAVLGAEQGGVDDDIWSGDKLMLASRGKKAQQSQARIDTLSCWLGELIKKPERLLRKSSVFTAHVPEPQEHNRQSLSSPTRKTRARASKTTRDQTQPAAGGLTEEALECVAGPSNWAQPDDATDDDLSDRVTRLMGP